MCSAFDPAHNALHGQRRGRGWGGGGVGGAGTYRCGQAATLGAVPNRQAEVYALETCRTGSGGLPKQAGSPPPGRRAGLLHDPTHGRRRAMLLVPQLPVRQRATRETSACLWALRWLGSTSSRGCSLGAKESSKSSHTNRTNRTLRPHHQRLSPAVGAPTAQRWRRQQQQQRRPR